MSFPSYSRDTISGKIQPDKGITVSGGLPVSYCVFTNAKSNKDGNAVFVNTSSLDIYWNSGVIFRSAWVSLQCTSKAKGFVRIVSGETIADKSIPANSTSGADFTDIQNKSISYITTFNFVADFSATTDFIVILSRISFYVFI